MNRGPTDEALSPQSDRRVRQEPRDRWDDLVLPEREKRVLQAAVAELDARRTELLFAGSDRARAHQPRLTLLFAGIRGTGKTLAVQLLADELGAESVTLDLVGISALDRGEAENEIGRAVVEAKESRALLVFDRADALLESGSPETLRPKHVSERGPAFELSELVERGHRYPGVVVITSWVTPRFAPSLTDGMSFVVEFPLPSYEARKQIWRRRLPPDARVDDDDLSFLAGSFLDAGATIRDCCVAATAAAAAEGVPVQMTHIGRALQREYKMRHVSPRTDAALTHLLDAGAAGAAPASRSPDQRVTASEKPAPAAAAGAIPAASAAGPPKSPPAAGPPRSPPAAGPPRSPPAAGPPRSPPAAGPPRSAPATVGREPALAPASDDQTLDPKSAAVEPAVAPASDDQTLDAESAAGEPAGAPTPDNQAAEVAPTTSEALQARIAAALGRVSPGESSPESNSSPSLDDAPSKPVQRSTKSALATAPVDEQVAERARPYRGAVGPALLVGILLAAVLGFASARLIGGGASPAPLTKDASAGPVRISFPSAWYLQTLPRAQARGLSHAIALGPASGAHGLLVIGTSHADSRNLLSRPLRVALSGRSPANVVTLGGLNFTVSSGASSGPVYALPTTAGTVFGVCLTSSAAPGFTHSCEQILSTITLTAGRVLPPGQSANYAAAVNRALRKLSVARTKADSELRLARSTQAQAAAANALAAAHDAAASALSRLTAVGQATAANSSLVAALRATAGAYAALARDAADNDASGYRDASGAVARANGSLQSALHRLGDLGYQVG